MSNFDISNGAKVTSDNCKENKNISPHGPESKNKKLRDERVKRNAKIRVISTLPTEGSTQTFKYIFEPKEGEFVLELPEGTSVETLTPKNYLSSLNCIR